VFVRLYDQTERAQQGKTSNHLFCQSVCQLLSPFFPDGIGFVCGKCAFNFVNLFNHFIKKDGGFSFAEIHPEDEPLSELSEENICQKRRFSGENEYTTSSVFTL
jgi:hypothetical protein